jgi:hypothetical protein
MHIQDRKFATSALTRLPRQQPLLRGLLTQNDRGVGGKARFPLMKNGVIPKIETECGQAAYKTKSSDTFAILGIFSFNRPSWPDGR